MHRRTLLPALIAVLAACSREPELPTPASVLGAGSGDATSKIVIDSANAQVILYAGPFRVPTMDHMPGMAGMAGMPGMADMPGMKHDGQATNPAMPGMKHEAPASSGDSEEHGVHAYSPLVRFNWPIEGFYRGFRVALVDAAGRELPRQLMHHLIGVDFAHRQLLQGDLERIVGAGLETPDVVLPRFVGVPMHQGQELGIYAGWHNEMGKDYDGVYIRLAMPYVPANALVKPIAVFPVYMDVNNIVGQTNAFPLPPGRSTRTMEFAMPIKGRFLGVGGHLHDFGVEVRLEDVESGKVLTRVQSVRDSVGRVLAVGHEYFPLIGLRMTAGRRYRIVGEYDSMRHDTVPNGAMAHMIGLFAPTDPAAWPTVNASDAQTRADLESLPGGPKAIAPVIGAMAKGFGGG